MNSGVLAERGFSGITTLYLLPVPHHLRPPHGHNIGFSLFSQHILPFHGFLPALVQRGLQPRHLLISACRNLTIPPTSAHTSRLQLKENPHLSCTPPPLPHPPPRLSSTPPPSSLLMFLLQCFHTLWTLLSLYVCVCRLQCTVSTSQADCVGYLFILSAHVVSSMSEQL